VERYVDGAELGDGEVDRRILEAFQGERCHTVATPNPEGAERVREAVRQLVEALVRDPVRTDDVCGPPGTVARVAPHDLSQEQGHWAPSLAERCGRRKSAVAEPAARGRPRCSQ